MSNPEANRQPKHVKEWLDMVAKVQKAETELAEAKMFGLEQYNLHHKTRAERDRLREALERIRSFTTFEVQDSFPIYEVDAIARNALAGGSEMETRCSPDRLRRMVDQFWDLINNSKGVDGLHLNGDLACWEDLLPGGQLEEWLSEMETEEEQRVQEARCDCYPSPESWMVCRYCGKDILDSGTET